MADILLSYIKVTDAKIACFILRWLSRSDSKSFLPASGTSPGYSPSLQQNLALDRGFPSRDLPGGERWKLQASTRFGCQNCDARSTEICCDSISSRGWWAQEHRVCNGCLRRMWWCQIKFVTFSACSHVHRIILDPLYVHWSSWIQSSLSSAIKIIDLNVFGKWWDLFKYISAQVDLDYGIQLPNLNNNWMTAVFVRSRHVKSSHTYNKYILIYSHWTLSHSFISLVILIFRLFNYSLII